MRAVRVMVMGLAVLAMLAQGAVAAQVDEREPQVTDPCGDADRMAFVGDTAIGTPDAERASGFDVSAARFTDLEDGGVEVLLELCGDVPAPELGSEWSVRWDIGGDCERIVTVLDTIDVPDPTTGVQRGARLSEQCNRHESTPVGASSYGETTWIKVLPATAYAVEGRTLTWTLTADLVPADPGERTAFLEIGTVWSGPKAYARDGRWLTEVRQGDAAGVNGPGALDQTAAGRDFTVGETLQ